MNKKYLLVKNIQEMKEWLLQNSNLPLTPETLEILAQIEMKNLIEAKLLIMRENNINQEQLQAVLEFYCLK